MSGSRPRPYAPPVRGQLPPARGQLPAPPFGSSPSFSRPYLGLARASVSFARFLIGKENLCCGYKHQRPRLALLLAPVFFGRLHRRFRPCRPLRFLLAVDHPPRSRARRHRPAAPSWCRTRRRGAAPRRRGWPFSGCSWQRRGTHHRAARDRRNSPRRAPRAWFKACSSTCARISGKKVKIVSLGANDPETARRHRQRGRCAPCYS
eukprot:scaffold8222_cov72-Phaeocystis_antarctica.AAC.1